MRKGRQLKLPRNSRGFVETNPIEINHDICRIFRKHNILEYKRPDDELTIDVIAKVLAYTNLYKSLGTKVNEIPYNALTATIYRHTYPRDLIILLKKSGLHVEHAYEGVYSEEDGPLLFRRGRVK